MGKPFATELTQLPTILEWAANVDVTSVAKFFAEAHGNLLIAIGAGGSYTTAEFARLLHESRGDIALAHTPLSFLQAHSDIRSAYVVIFTASGNNRDVLATYEAAVDREPQGILIICGKRASKVERKAEHYERTTIFARSLPTGRDGFLATNSLAAFCAIILRAFGYPAFVASDVLRPPKSSQKWTASFPEWPAYFLALFGGWGRPAAVDLESKFSEAGLGGVMLADYRHFAHGRHNWIDKRNASSVVVAFITPETAPLATKTLTLLPPSTRIIRLETKDSGPAGALELLLAVFGLTSLAGEHLGIDPGRPGVPGYGRRIYHLGPMMVNRRLALGRNKPPVVRKLAARGTLTNPSDKKVVADACTEYLHQMKQARFGALVADFDGTVVPPGVGQSDRLSPAVISFFEKLLRNNIKIYFATGRGDSIHAILATSLDSRLHSHVFVSYYNGAVTSALSEAPPKPEGAPHHREFDSLLARLKEDPFVAKVAKFENKSFQLTLKPTHPATFPAASAAIRELVARNGNGHLRIVQSSHSLDVIPFENTKLNCVRIAQSRLPRGTELLTIGDRGSVSGNDFDLLTHKYSLSVDTVSSALDSCWNLLPAGVRNVGGLVHYAKLFRVKRGHFAMAER